MFKYILVPLDGSLRAERAVPVAARIARASNACVLLVRAVEVPITFGVMYEGRSLKWRLLRDETEVAQQYLHAIAQAPLLENLKVETSVRVGQAAEVIIALALRHRAELVVMTSHGRTGLGRWVLGSVADHVVHHSPVPTLILRDRQEQDMVDRVTGAQPLRILVPLDGSPQAEAVLTPLLTFAQALGGANPIRVHLVQVVTPYTTMAEHTSNDFLTHSARVYLEQVAQRLHECAHAMRLNVSYSVVAEWDVAQCLVELAKGGERTERQAREEREQHGEDSDAHAEGDVERFDLIGMATHGYGWVARWTLGSVTERVLHGTKLPLFIVRPREVAKDT